jgi:hypothetical protein
VDLETCDHPDLQRHKTQLHAQGFSRYVASNYNMDGITLPADQSGGYIRGILW